MKARFRNRIATIIFLLNCISNPKTVKIMIARPRNDHP